MNNWKKILPAGLAAAAGAAAAVIAKKKDGDAPAAKPAAAKKAPAKNLAAGTYSFVSGYRDAKTVDVSVKYNADRYTFSVVEEEFLASTSDSHVALVMGGDFNAQVEYASYYAGDDFAAIRDSARSSYRSFAEIGRGYRYSDGDSVCVCLPVDEYSYLLITAMIAKGSRLKLADLPTAPEFVELIENIEI